MKLRTLKDLNNECRYMDECCRHCIRAEAIKWVKDCKVVVNGVACIKIKEGFEKCSGCGRFMQFFNITEEELK